jgi:hypothetical protein
MMMAFVNEKISEEDKARIDWSPYLVLPQSRSPFEPFMWTIDRNRDVFLMWIGKKIPGPHLGPVLFGLSWKGTLIHFLANVKIQTDPAPKRDMSWDIELPIPDALMADKTEIQIALKEAIEAHGYQYSGPDSMYNVHISIH